MIVSLTSVLKTIDFVYKNRQTQLQALNSANGPLVFIGEWVNEMSKMNGSQSDYQDYGRAQLEVYNAASFGWAYWCLKNDRKHWDLEWNIQNDYLQLDAGDSPKHAGDSPKRKISYAVMLVALSCGYYFLHHIL
ncbi:hypothetical protein ACHQM5_009077 [Ranunculus cassubicifolius]